MHPADRRWSRVGVALGLLWVGLTAAGIAVWAYDGADVDLLVDQNAGNNAALGLSLGVLAAVLTGARPRNPLGWWLQALGLTNSVTVLGEAYAAHDPTPGPLGMWAGWVASWIWAAGFVPSFSVLFAIYPSGRAQTRSRRAVVAAALVAGGVLLVGLMLSDEAFQDNVPGRHNPLTGGGLTALSGALALVGAAASVAVVLAATVQTLVRLRRSRSPERQQLAWLVATALPVMVAAFTGPVALAMVCTVLSPLGVVIGVLRYRLLDIQLVLRRTLVYGLLTAVVVVVYAGTVLGLSSLVPSTLVPGVLAAAVVAVGVRPAHDLLQRWVTRLVYGDRHDPVQALSRLGRGLREGEDPLDPLAHVVRSVQEALRVPAVALVAAGTPVAGVGDFADLPRHEVPLTVARAPVGTLVVSDRSPGDPLHRLDRDLLEVLAGPVAVAVQAATLAAQLGESRERVVAATDAERDRLRRDLHDGLGPSLSGVALGLEAAQLELADGPATGARLADLLARLLGETQQSVAEVRRIVDDLRPAALDGSDLVTAVRAHATAVQQRSGGRLVVGVTTSEPVLVLPPAVEVAAYRIVLEALTNVVRHSGARSCQIELRGGDVLELEVRDDGCGPVGAVASGGTAPTLVRAGVGIESMRARAGALGGFCLVEPVEPCGTRLLARLPLVAGP